MKKRKKKTPKQILKEGLESENKSLCYWITVANSKGIDAYDQSDLRRPVAVHHYIHKAQSNALRFCLEDLFAMYQGNHYVLHKSKEPEFVARILKQKGQKWHDKLLKIAHDPLFKYTIDYLKDKNNELKLRFAEIFKMEFEDFNKLADKEDKNAKQWQIIYRIWPSSKIIKGDYRCE